MERNTAICTGMEGKLADLLLDPQSVPEKVKSHVAECDACHREVDELRATMAALDAWEAPEPNPYFMTRFQSRLREEKLSAPASWPTRVMDRIRARLMFGPRMSVRPLAAMALTTLLLLGGGTYLDFYWQAPPAVPPQTAVVHDLQTLDNNAQLLDQLESIAGDDNPGASE